MRKPDLRILLCAFITLLNDRLGETVLLPLLPKLKQNFGVSAISLGLLAGTYALAQFTVAPLIGALSDRFGRKPIITFCVFGSVIGLSIFAITIGIWNSYLPIWSGGAPIMLTLLFLSRIIDGASGGTVASATAILADISSPSNRAKAFGLIGVAFGLGFVLGPFLGGLLTNKNIILPGIFATIFAIINLLVVLFILKETHPPVARKLIPKKRELNPLNQLVKVFTNPLIRRLGLAFFLFFMAFNGLTSFLLLYLEEVFGWEGILPGLSLAWVGVVAMIVQGGLIGPLVNKFGELRLTLFGIGFVIIGCLLLAIATKENSIPIVFTAEGLLALGTGLVVPCLRALVSKKLDNSGQGAALGSLQGLQSLGTFLGAAAAGLVYEELGARSPFWIGMIILIMVGWLVRGGLPSNRTRVKNFSI